MSDVHTYSSDVAFTPAVKAIQTRKGSRETYAHVEERGGWRSEIDENLAGFLAETNSFYLATAAADGQPYVQHRGGPKGFIKVLDKNTIAFADYSGNRQYITQGNLSENPKAHIFVMDYAHRRRVKIWGEARVVEDDPALTKSLMPQGYKARPEQVILYAVESGSIFRASAAPRRTLFRIVATAVDVIQTSEAGTSSQTRRTQWLRMDLLRRLVAPAPRRIPDNTAASSGRHRR